MHTNWKNLTFSGSKDVLVNRWSKRRCEMIIRRNLYYLFLMGLVTLAQFTSGKVLA